jgi:NADH-quinone oxidoreductase subunit K
VIHLAGPVLLVAVLAGIGVYGVLARRNAVMVLVGAELLLNSVALLLVTVDAATADPLLSGQVLTLFLVTVAAAEIGLALAVVLLLFRHEASSDLREARSLGETATGETETCESAAGESSVSKPVP